MTDHITDRLRVMPIDIFGVKLFEVQFNDLTLVRCDTREDAENYIEQQKSGDCDAYRIILEEREK